MTRSISVTEGRWVCLSPIATSDEEWLRALMSDPALGGGYRYRGLTPGPEQFGHDLWDGVLAQFVIRSRATGHPAGLVCAFNASLRDGHAHLAVVLEPAVRGRGWPIEGVGLFVDHLFEQFELRKLYVQLSELTPVGFRSALGQLVVEEARLLDHDTWHGRRGDSVIYALWREAWFSPTNRCRHLLLGHLDAGVARIGRNT